MAKTENNVTVTIKENGCEPIVYLWKKYRNSDNTMENISHQSRIYFISRDDSNEKFTGNHGVISISWLMCVYGVFSSERPKENNRNP